jgi:hypothetical protein
MLRPTADGWGVYLTNGRELARYRGIWSKQLALRYLRRYVRETLTPRRPPRIGLR